MCSYFERGYTKVNYPHEDLLQRCRSNGNGEAARVLGGPTSGVSGEKASVVRSSSIHFRPSKRPRKQRPEPQA